MIEWEQDSSGVTWTHPDIGLVVRVKSDHHGAFKVCLTEKEPTPPGFVYEDERWGFKTEAEALAAGRVLVRALMEVFGDEY